jgi:general secretion pathway protein A
MVLDYYKLREQPFGVTPDSRYLFLGPAHREALASLLYGVDAGCGVLVLIAPSGLGKTTLLFHVMNQLREKAKTVLLCQTVCTPLELLRAVLTGLGVQETDGTFVHMQIKLKEVLESYFQQGKRVVTVIDEAQNLDESVLEAVRMLSNFETSREKLMQIVLSGQPGLAEKIALPEQEKLRQRISIFAGLEPFSREDTEFYIEHRLRIAGYTSPAPLFTRDAFTLITNHTGGVPRNINNLCFSSMSLASALKLKSIDSETVREVIADLDVERFHQRALATPHPVQKRPLEMPAHPPSPRASSAVWISKAIPAILVIMLLGAVIWAARWLPQRAAEHAQTILSTPVVSAAPTLVSEQPSAVKDKAAIQVPTPKRAAILQAQHSGNAVTPRAVTQPALPVSPPQAGERVVSVTPGKTLVSICMESFGSCDEDAMRKIRELNPELSNLDHVEIGQKIRIPASAGENRTP